MEQVQTNALAVQALARYLSPPLPQQSQLYPGVDAWLRPHKALHQLPRAPYPPQTSSMQTNSRKNDFLKIKSQTNIGDLTYSFDRIDIVSMVETLKNETALIISYRQMDSHIGITDTDKEAISAEL